MDLLDRIRELGVESKVEDGAIEAARARLAKEISEAPAGGRGRARRWIGIGAAAGVLAAAGAATVVVVAVSGTPAVTPAIVPTSETAPTPAPTPRVTVEPAPTLTGAAAVLDHAAALALTSVKTVAPGQYLRVEHHLEQLVTYAEGVDEASPYNATRENATAAWVARSSYAIYMPADRGGDWFRVFEPDRQIISLYGADAEALSNAWSGQMLQEPIVEHYKGGLDFVDDKPIYASDAYFAAMPRDPGVLVAWYRDRLSRGNVVDVDESVVAALVQDLELNAAPPDLQGAMFRALALIDGVTVQSADAGVTTLAFPFTGSGRPLTSTVSIDDDTGLVVESTVRSSLQGALVPADVPESRVTTTISVVDSAP